MQKVLDEHSRRSIQIFTSKKSTTKLSTFLANRKLRIQQFKLTINRIHNLKISKKSFRLLDNNVHIRIISKKPKNEYEGTITNFLHQFPSEKPTNLSFNKSRIVFDIAPFPPIYYLRLERGMENHKRRS